MSGALVGFRINGVNKLTRLHGERSCEQVLVQLLAYLRATNEARLASYARSLHLVQLEDGLYPPPQTRDVVQSFLEDYFGETCPAHAWSEVFAALPEMEAWHAGLPFMLGAVLETCGDVSWGFLINLDAGHLQIFENRHAHFRWRDLDRAHPYCTLLIAHARQLSGADPAALHQVLHAHSFSDGIDPVLPLRDGMSASFAGPPGWSARLQLRDQHVHLLLQRDSLQVEVAQVGELRLDHPDYGAFLCQSLDPAVLSLAQSVYGPGASLTQLARVAARLPELPFTAGDSGLPLLDLGLRPSSGLGLTLGSAYFDGLKVRLLEAGMSKQGWRFLVRQPAPQLRFLLGFFPPSARNLREFSHMVNLLATALQDEAPPLGRCQPALRGVERILERGMGKISAMREENARIYLRCIMRATLTPEDEYNLVHEAQDVSDFVYAQHAVLPGAKITWQSLCRRSDAWHRAGILAIPPERDVRWLALLPRHAIGDLLAIELDSGALLAEEGLEQKHCVGTYANACASGSCRVFSLRREGRRLATVELRRDSGGHWDLAQVRGKCNGVISDARVLAAADALAQAYAALARRPERMFA
jgi:hypothetical protein